MSISVVVNYCSLDQRFIRPLLRELLRFTDDVIIVTFDKLLNGDYERLGGLDEPRAIDASRIRTLCLPFSEGKPSRFWHNLARWEGAKYAKCDRVLFLDADEIPDGALMRDVLGLGLLDDYDAVDFQCNWYFRSACFQAVQTEQCGLLLRRELLREELVFTEFERWSYRQVQGIRYLRDATLTAGPFVHHFSWVRTRDEMLTKVSSWGHRHDRDWRTLIAEEFSRDFNGTDFVHQYTYLTVADRFGIGL